MSFKFDFQLEEDDETVQVPIPQATAESSSSSSSPSYTVTLDDLLDSLPATISYTPFNHPNLSTPLLRRDLFDARFQLISQEQDGDKGKGKADDYVDAKTDLIPGLYEGGLKTWEGGVDLLDVLSVGKSTGWIRGKRVLEVGCGTALPSCYLLQALLSTTGEVATLHLQDYNLLVLQLVTLPNLLLAALPFLPADALRSEDADPEADQDLDGHLNITSAVKDAFKSLLDTHSIKLEFNYGHWAGLSRDINHGYDLVITAETIYAEDSVNDLLAVLKSATKPSPSREDLQIEDKLDTMSVKDDWIKDIQHETVILVAAKVLYFGVGGGLAAFLQLVESDGGWSTGIQEWTKGVGRAVVRVGFGGKAGQA